MFSERLRLDAEIEDDELLLRVTLLEEPAVGASGCTWAEHWDSPETRRYAAVRPVYGDANVFEVTADELADQKLTVRVWVERIEDEVKGFEIARDELPMSQADIGDSLS